MTASGRQADRPLLDRVMALSGGSAVVNVLSSGAAFASHVAIARIAGAEVFGLYMIAIAWVSLASFVAIRGWDLTIVRYLPRDRSQRELRDDLLSAAERSVVAASIAIAAVMALVLGGCRVADLGDPELIAALYAGLPLVALMALSQILASVLVVHEKVVVAQSVPNVIRPIGIIAILSAVSILDLISSPMIVMSSTTVGTLLTTWALYRIARRDVPKCNRSLSTTDGIRKNIGHWAGYTKWAFGISTFTLAFNQLDIQIAGWRLSAEDVGMYAAAARLAMYVAFPANAINSAFAPAVAKLWQEKDIEGIQRLTSAMSKRNMLACSVVAVILVVFGEYALALFGEEFRSARECLIILVGGRLAFACTALGGHLLNMTSNHRSALGSISAALVVALVTSVFLSNRYGIEGLAAGMACGCVAWSAITAATCAVRVRVRLW